MRRSGALNRKIRVTTNDPAHPKVDLVCDAYIRTPFREDPLMARFRKVKRDSGPQSKTILFHRGDGGPLKPRFFDEPPSNIEAVIREITPGEEYAIDVTVSPPWPPKRIDKKLRIGTGVAEGAVQFLRVLVEMIPRLTTAPKYFTVPKDLTNGYSQALRIMWDKKKTYKVLRVEVDDPQLTAKLVDSKRGRQVVLAVPSTYDGWGGPNRKVTLYTDDPETKSQAVTIRFVDRGKRRAAGNTLKPKKAKPRRESTVQPTFKANKKPNEKPVTPQKKTK